MIKAIALTGTILIAGFAGAQTATVDAKDKAADCAMHAKTEADCPMHAKHAAKSEAAKTEADCPMHAKHVTADGSAHHGHEVDSRHDTFGMPHEGTRHSFRLFGDGGAIELRAEAADDAKTVQAIRTHLQEIADRFAQNDFSGPAFVHGTTPAGVAEMQKLSGSIGYRYEEVPSGGRVRITAKGADAVAAVHEFLKFQVVEHRTADSGKVEADR